jgi:uncharacterized protein (TIGR00369 family)
MVPSHPDFEQRVREDFQRQAFMDSLGARVHSVAPGRVEIAVDFHPSLTQQDGFLHAGVTTTLLDVACGYAALTLMEPQQRVLSVEFKTNLLSPGVGKSFWATGEVVRRGRTLTICTGSLTASDGENDKPIALMQATMIAVDGSN